MGLLARISGDLVEYINWQNKEQKRLVYKFDKYRHHIKTGGKIQVNENEAAVFVSMGRIADVLTPGEYPLDSSVLPELAEIQNWKKTGPESFISDIFFINTGRIDDIPWNTAKPLILGCGGRKIESRLRGKYSIQVSDSRLLAGVLMKKGAQGQKDAEDILSGFIYSGLEGREYSKMSEITEKGAVITDEELDKIKMLFRTSGTELCSINIENIVFPDSEAADDLYHVPAAGQNIPGDDVRKHSDALYYTIENGSQTGPYNISQLIGMFMKNEISKTTYVWTAGMEKWQTAGTVRELQSVFSRML